MFKYIIPILFCFDCYASDFSCENVNDKMFEHELLSTYSPESITSIYVNFSSSDSKRIITDRSLKTMATHCPNLKTLIIYGENDFSDEGVAALASGCSKLESLSIWPSHQQCDKVTDKGLDALAKGCPKLKEVTLNGYKEIGSMGVVSLSEHCPLLNKLELDGGKITDEALIALGKNCPKLEWLDLPAMSDKTGEATDVGLKAIAEGCSELYWVSLYRHPEVANLGVMALAKNCSQLDTLLLTGNGMTDEGLTALGNGCPELSFLGVPTTPGFKGNITDQGLEALSVGCFELTGLNIEGHTKITDRGVLALVENAPYLKGFWAAGNGKENKGQLTDESLMALADYSDSIESIDVSQNLCITFVGVKALFKRSPSLKDLGVEQTSITRREYTKLCQMRPKVKIRWSK